jgi:Mrp family chromosome partitioning ATPase
MLDLAAEGSLVRVLTAQRDLSDEVHRVRVPEGAAGDTNRGAPQPAVDVLFAGPPPTDPLELFASERIRQLLRAAEERYELVVIDAPPLLAVADAAPLAPAVSGTLVVVRIGHTARSDAHRLAERLWLLRARALGVVVNYSERSEALDRFYAERRAARGAIPA